MDTVRGTGTYGLKKLFSNATWYEDEFYADATREVNTTSNGISLSGGGAHTNQSSATYVAWTWKAGGNSNTYNINDVGYATASAAGLTAGSITPTGASVNTKSGFSVVTWTATGGAATIGHGLGVAPTFIIVKDRDSSTFWQVYHISIGNTAAISLNSTNASTASINQWNNTSPTSTVFSVGLNSNYLTDKHVAYCFAPVVGYSSFGSYVGNGSSDGVFVYTGFRVKWYLIKQSSASGENWRIIDATRSPYNVAQDRLLPNNSAAEAVGVPNEVDFLSNGFKIRSSDGAVNASGSTYIYYAVAENPFQYARAR